jgi:Tfp pilus assembly protein PilX
LASAPVQMLVDLNGDGDFDDPGERPIFSLVSATSEHGYARVTSVAGGTDLSLGVASNSMQQFADGDKVRVFRPVNMAPRTDIFSVTGTPSGDTVVLSGAGGVASDVSAGDLLLRLPSAAEDDDSSLQIDYQLGGDPDSSDPNMNQLRRRITDQEGNVIEDWQLIAGKISGITLTYLDNTGSSIADLDKIIAIQIAITGQTDATRTGRSNYSGVKDRTLSTTIKNPQWSDAMRGVSNGNGIRSQEGFALILTMSMLIILSVLGILVLTATNTDLAITTNYRSASDAFSAAERAVEYAANPDILFQTGDTHLGLVDGSDNLVTDETVAGLTVADRWAHLQDTASGTELTKSTDLSINVINNLGPSELPVTLRNKFGDEFAGNYYRINVEARARNNSRARIETEKVRIFKKSDDSVFVTTSEG